MSILINKVEYKIIKELGEGGYGKVNQVLNKSDNKYYALKEIPIKGEAKEKINDIKNEANILAKFNCNNIVKYFNSYQNKEKFYILMEYCAGKNLRDFIDEYLNNNTLIEESFLYKIIKQICIGIKEIHKMKIVHRDLKPENIFMNESLEIKIGDFGISKKLNSYKIYTSTKNKSGTDYYKAPEIMKEGIYNEKSDIWSLGCIIYELFTLNIYFMDKFMDNIKKIDPEYNPKWQELIDSLLQIEYNKRLSINDIYNILEKEIKINNNINKKIDNEEKNISENKIINMNINIEKKTEEKFINKEIIYRDIQTDYLKFVIMGEGRVGKTSLLMRYFENRFNENEKSTIKPSFYEKTKSYNGKAYELKFWDTAGQEKFNALTTMYFQNAIGALLVYDVNFQETFEKVKIWLNMLRELVGKNVIFVLVGNKIDLLDKSSFDKSNSQVNEFIEKEKCKFFYTSCKTGFNVNEAFDELINSVLEIIDNNNIVLNKRGGKKLVIKTKDRKKKGCC